MKIRYQAGILAAALSLSMMTMAFAAGSAGTGMAGGGGGSSSRPNKIGGGTYSSSTSATGPAATTGTSGTLSGSSSTGSGVSFSDNFGSSIDGNKIAQVNEGLSTIQSLPSDSDLTGYNPLVRIQNMTTTAPADGQPTQVSIYVPNLVSGLNNIQILIQNPSTGKWELVMPTAVNTEAKTVTVSLNYAGPVTVVYKN